MEWYALRVNLFAHDDHGDGRMVIIGRCVSTALIEKFNGNTFKRALKHKVFLNFKKVNKIWNKTYSCLKYLKANSIMENFPSSVSVSEELMLLSSSCKGEWICLAKMRSSGLDCNIDVWKIGNIWRKSYSCTL